MLTGLRKIFGWAPRGGEGGSGGRGRKAASAVIRARIDSGTSTNRNAKHWANADALSANALMSSDVRKRLRDRARYEYTNNCWCHGMIRTKANDVVGSGPRLQILESAEVSEDVADKIERAFTEWMQATGFVDHLRECEAAIGHSGEVFVQAITNPKVKHPVKLDVRLIEAERCTHGTFQYGRVVDGIEFDGAGNRVAYMILPTHPGEFTLPEKAERIDAGQIAHYFEQIRPEQQRGIPKITPALNLFAQKRRFTEATLDAAEFAARFAGVLESDAAGDPDAEQPEPADTFDLEPGAILTLPPGGRMNQVKAEHPTSTYKDFTHELLNEMARCMNMPFNIAAANSSGYNYASGRLDHQVYFREIRVCQLRLSRVVLDWIFEEWLKEAVLIEGLLPPAFRRRGEMPAMPHCWYWDGAEHVDPVKEADAQAQRLVSRTTSLAREYAKQGLDWRAELNQIAKERELMEQLGITPLDGLPSSAPSRVNDPEDDGEVTQ